MNSLPPEEVALSAAFPLPFRVLALVGFGILAWATNLHGLDLLGVDVMSAMDLRAQGTQPRFSLPAHRLNGLKQRSDPAPLYGAVYRIFAVYSTWCILSWTFYRYATHGDIRIVDEFGYIPGMAALFIIGMLFCPFNVMFKHERNKFVQALRRCLFSSMDTPIYFADVVFADIFTSFAKVFGNAWLSVCMLLPGNSILVAPIGDDWTRWIMPTIMSLPYFVRLRQCIIEYTLPTNESRRPLFNALKYATSFPVIYLSAAQRMVVAELRSEKGDEVLKEAWHGEHRLFRLWLLAAVINSIYSFWWDTSNDWGLNLLKPHSADGRQDRPSLPRHLVLPRLHSSSLAALTDAPSSSGPMTKNNHDPQRNSTPYGLRSTLLYPLPVYPLLVMLNFLLRLLWSMKLSSHLHLKADGSEASLLLEIAEVVRRWIWVFIRIEWEVIKKAREEDSRVQREDVSGDEGDYELISSTSASSDLDRISG